MKISIRNEKSEDFRKVEEKAREAFWNLYFPGCNEHVAIHKLRKSDDFIPELTYVLELDGEIAGAIFYSTSRIVAADGSEYPMVSFGPVFIDPEYQRQGLGLKLINHSIEDARKMGHRAIIIIGYPYHYEPYGFKGGKIFGISMPDGKFYKGLLVLPLYKGALDGIRGYVVFSDSLEPSEEETEEYDKLFPFKEKKIQSSQREFEIASAELDGD
ncbi:MAG: N-acetyltransferase [Spirochaetales bacterium]|nr:N-acetyltransferase [Spirochaetales bacterium]